MLIECIAKERFHRRELGMNCKNNFHPCIRISSEWRQLNFTFWSVGVSDWYRLRGFPECREWAGWHLRIRNWTINQYTGCSVSFSYRSWCDLSWAGHQNPSRIHCGSSHTHSEQILLRKGAATVCRPCAAGSRYRHQAVCLAWSIVLSGSGDRFQSILPYSRSCKVFHKQTCRGGAHITIMFAFLADNTGIVPSGLLQLDMCTDFFGNNCGVLSQFSCNGRKLRPTLIVIRSLRGKRVFLAIVFSASLLPSSGEDEGALLLIPWGLSLLFPGRQ